MAKKNGDEKNLIDFTEEQKLAINSREKNILVSASAGSGKTSVLVERIIKLITDKKNPIPINKILAVTFTEAAAWQIKKKIAHELRLIKNKNENIKHQIILLDTANISTLHAFCFKLIRKYFYLVDIDPEFKIAEDSEIELIKSDVLNEVLEKKYASGEKNFFELAMAYNKKAKSDELKKLILKIYDFSRSICDSELWLKKCSENFICEKKNGIKKSLWWPEIFFDLKEIILEIKNLCEENILICQSEFGPEKYFDVFDKERIFFDELEKNLDLDFKFDDVKKKLDEYKFEKLFAYTQKIIERENIDLDLIEQAKKNRDEIKDLFKKLKEKIFFDKEDFILDDICNSHKIMSELINVVLDFKNELQKKKLELNVLSFDDLEELAIEILSSKKKEVKNDFYEILTDEYQDINDVQEKILNLISCESRFFVGDIKQSIYGFRNSSPELFVNKYNLYEKGNGNLKIDLNHNFRSRKEIIDGVNFIFLKLMTKKFGGINYVEQKKICDENNDFDKKNEFYLIVNENEQEEKIKYEARFICKKIKLLLKNNVCQKFSDIAVLIRSRANLKLIKEIFLENKINVETESDVNFFELPEIIILISYLKIIDSPLNDIALVSVLRSEIYNLSDNELLKIREMDLDKNFYECVKKYDGLEKFKSDLEILRREKNFLDISNLIYRILDLTDFFYLADINNKQAQKNIIRFICIAKDYEKSNYKGLFNFIRYLEKLEEMKININAEADNKNSVKIFTVHKSKGLEFKIVFFSFLGCDFNFKDLKEEILLDKEFGLGNKFVDINRRTKINTIARNAIEFKLKKKKLEEEMRLLYVAMTRAKEKLILTGSIKTYKKNLFGGNKYWYKHARNFLDWLLNCDLEKKFDFNVIDESENFVGEKNFAGEKKILPVPEIDCDKKIKKELFLDYEYDTFVKSKVSIAELKKNDDEEYVFDEPEFLKGKKNILGMKKGTAVHNVLKNLDLNLAADFNKINIFLDKLVKKNIIDSDEKKMIDVFKLKKFLASDLFYKIKNASFLKRELPFVYEFDDGKNNLDKSLIHGIIDCFFEYEKKLYLLDYKTNKIKDVEKINNLIDEYRLQLKIYRSALEKSFKRKIDFSLIYFFDIDSVVYM